MFGTYDSWKTTDRTNYGPRPMRDTTPCSICGDGSGPQPCSPQCLRTHMSRLALRNARRATSAARKAATFARQYLGEGDATDSARVVAVMARIRDLRAEAKRYRERARR